MTLHLRKESRNTYLMRKHYSNIFLKNSMAALLSKFRIKFHEIIVINMFSTKPQTET